MNNSGDKLLKTGSGGWGHQAGEALILLIKIMIPCRQILQCEVGGAVYRARPTWDSNPPPVLLIQWPPVVIGNINGGHDPDPRLPVLACPPVGAGQIFGLLFRCNRKPVIFRVDGVNC